MVNIPVTFGESGKGLDPTDDESLAQALRDGIDDCGAISGAGANGVLTGLRAGTPTTASTQITGAGATNWNVNVEGGSCIVNDVEGNFEPEADRAIHDTTQLVANGESCKAWIVASEAAGSVSKEDVKGTAATTGTEVAPTDAEITTAVGHANWTKLALCTINRTADTTVTQSEIIRNQRKLTDPEGNYTIKNIKT